MHAIEAILNIFKFHIKRAFSFFAACKKRRQIKIKAATQKKLHPALTIAHCVEKPFSFIMENKESEGKRCCFL